MYNTKFILSDGKEIYPGYLSIEKRQNIREKYADAHEYMRCGCRPDAKLFYRISEDLRIYPEHNNYHHDIFCSRYKDQSGVNERQTAYVVNDDGSGVVAFTSFDPLTFTQATNGPGEQDNTVPEDEAENIEEICIGKDEDIVKPSVKKEPKLSMEELVRSINVDSFTEKVLNNQSILSKEKFSTFVYYRMKMVRLARTRKNIGELSLEKDGCRFVYFPLAGILRKEENETVRCYIQTKAQDGKIYNNFVFPDVLQQAQHKFVKTYGIQPDEHTMVAGFQYLKKNRSGGSYKVMGRVHMFQTSDLGVYCRSMSEVNSFNALQKICQDNENIRYWIPPEDSNIGAIIEVQGAKRKVLVLFRTKKDERFSYDSSMYVPLVVGTNTVISEEQILELVNDKKEH